MKKFLVILFCVAILGGAFALPTVAHSGEVPFHRSSSAVISNRTALSLLDSDGPWVQIVCVIIPFTVYIIFSICSVWAHREEIRLEREARKAVRRYNKRPPSQAPRTYETTPIKKPIPQKTEEAPRPEEEPVAAPPPPPKPVIILQPPPKKADPPPDPTPISLPTPPPQRPDEIPTQHYIPRKIARQLPAVKPTFHYADRIPIDHFDILNIDPDFLTEKQAWDYVASIETPRGKRAVSEPFWIKNAKTDKTVTPYRASATFKSTNSLQEYTTTLEKCTCPDYIKRELPCKHMIALAIKVKAIEVDVAHLLDRDDYV